MKWLKKMFSKNTEKSMVKSFKDETVEYSVDIDGLSCTCKDWIEIRSNYSKDDPRRLCKHIIQIIDVNNLSDELKYFIEDIEYYKDNKYGTKIFNEMIYIKKADCKVVLKDSDWFDVYDSNGKKYGLNLRDINFMWTNNTGKPLNYIEIERFFYDDNLLEAIELFDSEKSFIVNLLNNSGYKDISLELNYIYVRSKNCLIYDVEYKDLKGNDFFSTEIEVSNENFKFDSRNGEGFLTNEIFKRNQIEVSKAKIKRQELLRENEQKKLLQDEVQKKYSETKKLRELISKYNISSITKKGLLEIIEDKYISDNIISDGMKKYFIISNPEIKYYREIRFYDNTFLELLEILKEKIDDYNIAKEKKQKKNNIYRKTLLNTPTPTTIETQKKYLKTSDILILCKAPFGVATFNKILKELKIIEKIEYKRGKFTRWILINEGLIYGDNILDNYNGQYNYITSIELENTKKFKWVEKKIESNLYNDYKHIAHDDFLSINEKEYFPHTDIYWKTENFLELYKQIRDIFDNNLKKKYNGENRMVVKNSNPSCPYCECSSTHKKGIRERVTYKMQRYQCSECKKIFQEKII